MLLSIKTTEKGRRNKRQVMGKTAATRETAACGHPTGESYKELDLVAMPQPIPKLGVEAGFVGTVDHVYKGGRKADVELSNDEGVTFGYATIEADPEPHVVAYYVVDDD
jgi:hypothetical protein